MKPSHLATVVVFAAVSLNAQKPADVRVIAVAHDIVAARRAEIGRSCATASDYVLTFTVDSITARGKQSAAGSYLPFRVVSRGVFACRVFDAIAAYVFRYQTNVRLKANDFDEWQSTGSEVENKDAMPLGDEESRKALTTATSIFLRNLVTAEEEYFANHSRYTTRITDLTIRAPTGIPLTIDVLPKGDGWSATADIPPLGRSCGIAINAINPVNSKAAEGLAACK
jgi:hypothetical protein